MLDLDDDDLDVLLFAAAVWMLLASAPERVPSVTPSPSQRLTLADLRALAAGVGFPDPDLAAAVAMAESRGDASAANIVTHPKPGNLPERSFGLWQVNTLAHPEFDEARLLDATYNANAALLISRQGSDWRAWSAFKDGTYRKFMPGA